MICSVNHMVAADCAPLSKLVSVDSRREYRVQLPGATEIFSLATFFRLLGVRPPRPNGVVTPPLRTMSTSLMLCTSRRSGWPGFGVGLAALR